MAGCPRLRVPAPAITPYSGGLFSAAITPETPNEDDWRCGVEYWTEACADARGWPADCQDNPPPKEPRAVRSLVRGDPFVVYAGPECDLVGSTLQQIRQSAITALQLGEQRAVERAFWTGDLGNWPSLAGSCCTSSPGEESPGDESPGENACCRDGAPCCVVLNAQSDDGTYLPLSVAAGLMQLEEYAGNNYNGVPIIHAPRGVSAFAASKNLMCVCGNGANTTPVGSRWAFYGGSPNTGPCNQPAPPCTAWMYVTGQVRIYRSDIFTTPPEGQLEQGFNARFNKATVLAEREYVLTRECICAAVLVNTACADC